ncbi:hypothetical protein CVU82_00990 [Candidatus Falkowbacteria bacterium HGW-Falkowbacteria-1]|uniref:Glycosyltransferase RgtA/B/C/D-like domain-containing protein n=1 Tax=Candidatus Falkowbacteria bacterium HGW-Falkowbacteria-1 TaxID=2013768 RepID=A0A2N2EAL6_9BACT|nr:MAG: hypothetical protein CVU82_00990 [Candidatus Falkowbacteria bacterium HGW-Falkowbacteria-1]
MNILQKTIERTSNTYKRDKFLPIVVIFSFIFFVLASILPYYQKEQSFLKFFSPDENANYVFTKLYAQTDTLSIFEKYNLIADDIVRPRSYISSSGFIKPVSFLGMTIIYGQIARFIGIGLIPFLTPFFASMALIFYYLLIKKFFGRKNALVSFFLFFSFPVLLYYSARSMFHNVLFLSFLIMALYFLSDLFERRVSSVKRYKEKYIKRLFGVDFLFSALSGLFFGLAIAVRSSELIWLFLAALPFFILKYKKLSFFRLSIFISFFILALIPVFCHNQILYNSPFYGGYFEMNKSIEEISQAGGGIVRSFFLGSFNDVKVLTKSIFNTIFYFGFFPRQSLEMFDKYFVKMFWYLCWPTVFGLFYFFVKDRKRIKKFGPYLFSWLIASFFLIFYYGSWKFVDNPDPSSFTIGNSYTRYWLPIYIGFFPFVAHFVLNIGRIFFFLKNKKVYLYLKNSISLIVLIVLMFLSFKFVYDGSEEGLKYYFAKLDVAKEEVGRIIELTESNAVVVTQYHDKFLFPERKVIVGRFNDDNMNKNYYKLAGYLPTYYYNFTFPESDLKYLNDRRLKEFGLQIELVETLNQDFSLYKVYRPLPVFCVF